MRLPSQSPEKRKTNKKCKVLLALSTHCLIAVNIYHAAFVLTMVITITLAFRKREGTSGFTIISLDCHFREMATPAGRGGSAARPQASARDAMEESAKHQKCGCRSSEKHLHRRSNKRSSSPQRSYSCKYCGNKKQRRGLLFRVRWIGTCAKEAESGR